MREHYVSFEQSQRLNKLGFDCDVCGYYYKDDAANVNRLSTPLNHNDSKKFKGILSAPRLDQVQAWLREEKMIDVEARIMSNGIIEQRTYYAFLRYPTSKYSLTYDRISKDFKTVEYDSYEAALSAAIDRALDILEAKQRQEA